MALRADNFASPTAATFEVLDDDLLMVSGSGTVEWSNWTDCTIQIPREKTVTSGTLVGIYDEDNLIDEFMIETQVKSLSKEGKPTWSITGPQINGLLGKIDVRPQDYPVKPSIVRDWIWAGQNLLTNPGMEDASEIAEIYEIDLDGATGGTFTLTVGGDTTPSQNFDVSEANLETAIEALTGSPAVVDVDVDAQSDGYRIEFADPATLSTAMTWVPSLTGGGGDEELKIVQSGDNTQPPVWTRSQFLDSGSDPKLHGTYASDGFRLTTGGEPVDTGSFALRVNGLTQYSGAQQVINVVPGQTYQISVRMYTSNSGAATEIFKLVMRDARNHKYLVSTSTSIPDNTWTTISIADFVVPVGVTQIIFRIASTVDQNPSPWYFDNAVFAEGFGAATPGEIIRLLLEAAQDRSVGDWIDLDFTDTDDTNSNLWGDGVSFRAFPPQTLAHVLEGLHQLGVNYTLKRKTTPSGALTHDLRAYGKDINPDKTSTVEIMAVQDATVKDRLPAANSRIAYGDEGLWDELEDSAAISSFGKWEGGYEAQHLMSEAALATFLSDIEDEEQTNRLALQATMHQGDEYAPLVLFRPGDLVKWQFPGIQPSVDKPVRTISWEQGDIARFQITGSKVFDNETSMARAVEFLLDEIKPRARLQAQGAAPLPVGGVVGGTPTIVVAASDASDLSKAKADAGFVCLGTNDQDVINQAIALLPLDSTVGGQIVLTEGTFNLDDPIDVDRKNMYIRGLGHDVTTLNFSTVNAIEFTGDTANFTISDLTFDGNSASVFALFQTSNGNIADFAVFRCNFLECGSGAILLGGTINEGTSRAIVYHNEFKECGGTNGQVEIGGTTSNGAVVVAMNFFYDGTERPIFGGGSVDGTASLNSFVDNTGTTPNVSGLAEVHNHASSSVSETYDADDQHTLSSPLTTKGDVFTYDTADARLGVGTNDQVLTADSAQSLGIKWADATGGGGGASGGGSLLIVGYGEDDLAASLTDSQLYRNVQGVETQIPVVMSRTGSIIGISVAASATRSAGTATFEVFKNGTGTGLTTVLDGTDTQYASSTQALSLDTFVADDRLDVRVTTDGSWAPTTLEVEAVITTSDGATAKSYITTPFLKPPDSADTDDIEFADFANGTDPTAAPGMSWGNQSGNSAEIRGGLLRIAAVESTSQHVGLFIAAPTGDFTVQAAHKINWLSESGSGAADTRAGVTLLWGTLATPTAIIKVDTGNVNGHGGFAWQRWSTYTTLSTSHASGAISPGWYEHTRLDWDSSGTSLRGWFGHDPLGYDLREGGAADASQSGDPDFVGFSVFVTNSDDMDISIPFIRFNWVPDFDPTTDN